MVELLTGVGKREGRQLCDVHFPRVNMDFEADFARQPTASGAGSPQRVCLIEAISTPRQVVVAASGRFIQRQYVEHINSMRARCPDNPRPAFECKSPQHHTRQQVTRKWQSAAAIDEKHPESVQFRDNALGRRTDLPCGIKTSGMTS